VPVKIPHNSVSHSDETDDSEPSTGNLTTSIIATAQLHLQLQIDVLNSVRTTKPWYANSGMRCITEKEIENN